MFEEVTIIFLSQNINLYPSYTQFCEGPKKIPTAAQDRIICKQKFQRDSLVNCITGYSVDEVLKSFNFFTKWRMCKVRVHFSERKIRKKAFLWPSNRP